MFWFLMVLAYLFVGMVAARITFVTGNSSKDSRDTAKLVGALWPFAVVIGFFVLVSMAVYWTFIKIGKVVFRETKAQAKDRIAQEMEKSHKEVLWNLAEFDPSLLTEDDRKTVLKMIKEALPETHGYGEEYRRLVALEKKIRSIDEPRPAIGRDPRHDLHDLLRRHPRVLSGEVVKPRPYSREAFEPVVVDTSGPWA